MREIKFRGLTAKGAFAYGLLSKDLPRSTAYYDEYSYRIHWHPESGGVSNVPVKNGTVGQYTGLKDKNGKEIYEADIATWYVNDVERTGEVYYTGQAFDMRNDVSGYGYIGWDALRGEVEVIGNIYETPELMEG